MPAAVCGHARVNARNEERRASAVLGIGLSKAKLIVRVLILTLGLGVTYLVTNQVLLRSSGEVPLSSMRMQYIDGECVFVLLGRTYQHILATDVKSIGVAQGVIFGRDCEGPFVCEPRAENVSRLSEEALLQLGTMRSPRFVERCYALKRWWYVFGLEGVAAVLIAPMFVMKRRRTHAVPAGTA